jgi:PAS domain S-box-containing protein
MISLCALYFGPWAAALSGLMTITCRLAIGGMGTIMGVSVILASVAIGLLGHFKQKPSSKPLTALQLYLFGIAVHIAMLVLTFTLPYDMAVAAVRRIGLPVILLYPLATILVGKILSDQVATRNVLTALRETKQNLDITLKSIGDAVISTDMAGNIVLMNPLAETLTGWRSPDALGRPLTEVFTIVHTTTRAAIDNPVTQVLAGGKKIELANHVTLIAHDGAERQIAVSAAPICYNTGGMIGVVLVFRDVTEEYRAREALRRNEALLRIAGRTARLGGWIVHPLENRVIWSDEAAAIHEMNPDVPPHLTEAIHLYAPEYRDRIMAVFKACLRHGTPFDEELQIITAGEHRRWVRTTGEAIPDDHGTITRIQGAVQDITERKHAEEALRQSEEDYRKLFEDHAAIKLIIDPQTMAIMDANHAAAAYYGWSREALQKMKIHHINTLSEEEIRKEINHAVARNHFHFEFRHRRADGSIRDVAVFSSKVRIKSGAYLHAIIHDITERKMAEKENRKLQDQFAQAQKMESIGRLAGGVAHDFNNMLSAIIGHAELGLEKVGPSDPLHEEFEEIRKAGLRSADLTRQLLAFARKQTIAPVVLDLNATIESMLKMLRRMIGENIDLRWHPCADPRPVKMDPAQIDQVLINLMVNARDAVCKAGKLTIETGNATFDQDYCAAHRGFTPGAFTLLAVSDDGCGMDDRAMTHLFEPFYTTKPQGLGTGLGLSTVYGIVKQNSGFINVYSEPGQGTTFKIYLPSVPAAKAGVPQEIVVPPAGGTETIMMVEDETAILKMGQTILSKYGYTVLAARTPSEALHLEQTHSGPIHMLITDVVMPEMNGKALKEKIAARRPGIKALFISGYTANVIAHHGVLEESIHFLQKPFSVKTMAAKVRDVLDRVV